MKNFVLGVTLLVSGLHLGIASAEDGVLEFWECTLNEGQTPADLAQANERWLAYVNRIAPEAEIRSWMLNPVVGEQGGFWFMDAFPSLAVWAQVQEAMKTAEGREILAGLNTAAACAENQLVEAVEH